jgi:hypothetical protein
MKGFSAAFASTKGFLLDGFVCTGIRLFDKTMLSFLVVSYEHRFLVSVTCTAEIYFNEELSDSEYNAIALFRPLTSYFCLLLL